MPKNPHANFSPVLDGYSGIGAFRFWCQTALPLTYDDSLSYYELLNKVVNYLNHTIEDLTAVESNTSALAEAYNKLQKYVNDYFDDLDVEAELRNVLDAMAEDGTLDALLNPLVENQLPGIVDEKIDDVVAEQIDGAVAGQIDESVADQLPALVDAGIPEEVSDWLEENVDPVGSAVVVDSSLSISGAAADAKVTGDKINALKTQVNRDLYYNETDTDAFYWRPNQRVNSAGSGYATNSEKYTALTKPLNTGVVHVYPGSKIVANNGYTLDYALRENGVRKQFQRGVEAGILITIEYEGELYLSVTDGTTDVSTEESAKALAKAGLTIDLITKPIKTVVSQNVEDIEELREDIEGLQTETGYLRSSFEYDREFTGYVNGFDIALNIGIGNTVDVNNPIVSATMCYGIIPCEAGDRFIVTGKGLSAPRAWGFTDTNYELLSVANSSITVTNLLLVAEEDGYLIVNSVKASPHSVYIKDFNTHIAQDVEDITQDVETLKKGVAEFGSDNNLTALVSAQQAIAEDWHFSFINVFENMGLGSNHIIPGTKGIWNQAGTRDLDQKSIWMRDGIHPFFGDGVTDMYARTIANQIALVSPSYKDGIGATTPSYWAGRTFLWMGTSIPAGSDPDAGGGQGYTYPELVALELSASVINKARGSSCVRINASTGTYTGMLFAHFLRAITRSEDECYYLADNWENIKDLIGSSVSSLYDLVPDKDYRYVDIMVNHSFTNLLLPYLNGTYNAPDLFVIDYGHNDVRPKGIDGKNDLWITPSEKMISDGILANDSYMTDNNYENLKSALKNNDFSGITDVGAFAASLNRNCFKGAVNFLITLILTYKPYARIVIVSDYN